MKPLDSESGAVLIAVAISMLLCLGFLAFVVDLGVLMVARAQAQNSADAAALAGAVARAFDETTDDKPAPDGVTVQSIKRGGRFHTLSPTLLGPRPNGRGSGRAQPS